MAFIGRSRIFAVKKGRSEYLIGDIVSRLKTFLEAHGMLTIDGEEFCALAVLRDDLKDASGTLDTSIQLIGHCENRVSMNTSGEIEVSFDLSGGAITADEISRGGMIILSTATLGEAVIAEQTLRAEGKDISFSVIMGCAGHTADEIHADGEISFSFCVNGGADITRALHASGTVVFLFDVNGKASIAENMLRETGEVTFSFGADSKSDIAENALSSEGIIDAGEQSADALATVEGYTIETNSAGGLTYIINASVYTLDGNTLIVWG